MRHFINMLKIINKHSLTRENKLSGLVRFIKWELISRLTTHGIVYPYVEDSKLLIKRHMDGATGNIIAGLWDYNEMGFTLHLLREDDLFIDIGSNVGVYSVLASAVKGARTIAIEPIPSAFQGLMDNVMINGMQDKIRAIPVGLGEKEETVKFITNEDCANHVATPEEESNALDVPVSTLNKIIGEDIPILLKLDVEGFEMPVLRGGSKVLENEKCKAVLIEINGSGEKYGYSDEEIHGELLRLNFRPYSYKPMQREFKLLEKYGSRNIIYIRDIDFVKKRIVSAPKHKVLSYLV